VDARLVRLEIVPISTQDRSLVCFKHTIGSEIVLDPQPMELLGGLGHVESRIGPFKDGVKDGER
jgi:hypothetical protein